MTRGTRGSTPRPLRRWRALAGVGGAALLLALAAGTRVGAADSTAAPAGTPVPGTPAAADRPVASGDAASPGKPFLVVFSLGPNWDAGKAPPEQASFREHGQNLGRLRKEERIALGARYADKGMIVLSAADEAEARAELDRDPGVVAGIFVYELHELNVFYDGCLERPKR